MYLGKLAAPPVALRPLVAQGLPQKRRGWKPTVSEEIRGDLQGDFAGSFFGDGSGFGTGPRPGMLGVASWAVVKA